MSAIFKTESHLKTGFATSAKRHREWNYNILGHGDKDGDPLCTWSFRCLAKTEWHQRKTYAWRCVCNSAPRAWQTDLRPPTDAGRGHPYLLSLRLPKTSYSCRSDAAIRHAHFHRDKNRIFCFICTNIIRELSASVQNSRNNRPVVKSHFEYFWLQSRARQDSKDSNRPLCLEKRKILNRKVMEKTWGGFVLRICLFLLQAKRETGTNVSQSDTSVPSERL